MSGICLESTDSGHAQFLCICTVSVQTHNFCAKSEIVDSHVNVSGEYTAFFLVCFVQYLTVLNLFGKFFDFRLKFLT